MGHGRGAARPASARRPTTACSGRSSGARASSQARHRRTDRVDRARLRGQLADRGRAPCEAAATAAARTVAAKPPASGRAGRRGWWCPAWSARPVNVEPPPAVRPDPLRRSRSPRPGPPARGPARCAVPRTRRCPRPGRGPGPGPRGRARRRSSPRRTWCRRSRPAPGPWPGSIAPASSRLPRQATPNRPPSSSQNAATASGRTGGTPRSAQQVDRGERGHDPERAVVGAAVRHRVQVTPGHDRRCRPARRARATRAGPTTPTDCRCGR